MSLTITLFIIAVCLLGGNILLFLISPTNKKQTNKSILDSKKISLFETRLNSIEKIILKNGVKGTNGTTEKKTIEKTSFPSESFTNKYSTSNKDKIQIQSILERY